MNKMRLVDEPHRPLRRRREALFALISLVFVHPTCSLNAGSKSSAPRPVRRAAAPLAGAPVDTEGPPACASVLGGANTLKSCAPSLGVPDRWKKLHDCERPNRWREFLDDEDCSAMLSEMAAEREQQSAAAAADALGVPLEKPLEKLAYNELVPHIATKEEFLAANARGARHGRMVVVKFYSKRCRACLRIAAKYRRLALKHSEEIDCFETEIHDGRALIEYLGVTEVPSIQIYDGDGATRIANAVCQPSDFKRIESKVNTARKGLARHPRLLRKWTGEERMIEGLHKESFKNLQTAEEKNKRALDDSDDDDGIWEDYWVI